MICHTMIWRGLELEAEIDPPVKGDQWDPPVKAEVLLFGWTVDDEDEALAAFDVETVEEIEDLVRWDQVTEVILEDWENR